MKKINFTGQSEFYSTLRMRVNDYFKQHKMSTAGNWRMYLKTIVAIGTLIGSYIFLVFFAESTLSAVIATFALAQGFVMVGFNVMHDGNHGSYSKNQLVNKLTGFTLDLIGGSQLMWRQKHNILHHTYTNITGVDDDLETSGLLRLSPDQPWRPWHRFQYLYALIAYSFLSLSWMMYNDFKKYFSRRIGQYRLRKNRPVETVSFFMTKSLYFSYMLIIPMFFHPILQVIIFFVGMHLILGLTLSVVFQLAHTLVDTEFPAPQSQSGQMENEWAIHQLVTTADFARNSRLATWYLGGLNFQVEHHLFSKICHIHYPKISEIVEQTSTEFSVPYKTHPTLWTALRAHFSFLKNMGRPAIV